MPPVVISSGVDTQPAAQQTHSQSHSPPQQPSAAPIKCRLLSTSLSPSSSLASALFCSRHSSPAHPRGSESCSVAGGGKAMGGATSPPPWRRHCALHFLVLLLWSVRTSCRFLWFYFMYFGWIFFFCLLAAMAPVSFRTRCHYFRSSDSVSLFFLLELCYFASYYEQAYKTELFSAKCWKSLDQ